ncbi:MAG: hypothetical protein AB2L14_13010 [Candidatus Xenobiia bacterium LiM19]
MINSNNINPLMYDSSVLYDFANMLYKRSEEAKKLYFWAGIIVGALTGYGSYPLFIGGLRNQFDWFGLIIGALIGAAIGYYMGIEKSFNCKLEAQKLLCQVKIEEGIWKLDKTNRFIES